MGFSTRAIHAGQEPDPATGAVIPPVHPATTFTARADGTAAPYAYARAGNPTRAAWERQAAALEGADYGIAFSSGMAAIDAVFCLLSAGDRVLITERTYGGTYRLLERIRKRHGITADRVPTHDLDAVRRALRPETSLLFVETPTNPTFEVTDLAGCATIAREHGVPFAVDSTFLTPYLQRPLEHGADLVVHSATKFLNGHSDVIGGIVLTSADDLAERLRLHQNAAGAVPSPFDCWLAMRGVKTLAVRMQRHQENASALAPFLRGHPAVRAVHWPGFEDHPQADVTRRQTDGAGGVLSVDLETGAAADRFLAALRVFTVAESLGGVESLVSRPATMSHAALPEDERIRCGITPGLLRLSVGIEDVDDLRADLDRALAAIVEEA